MRKILVGLLVLGVGCKSAGTTPGSATTGAASPRAAVETFLDAARAGDLQALAAVWGSEKGSVRESLDPAELEKRELIMICHFKTDSYKIVADNPGMRGERVLLVELRKRNLVRETNFHTVASSAQRWYVVDAEIAKVQDFCRS